MHDEESVHTKFGMSCHLRGHNYESLREPHRHGTIQLPQMIKEKPHHFSRIWCISNLWEQTPRICSLLTDKSLELAAFDIAHIPSGFLHNEGSRIAKSFFVEKFRILPKLCQLSRCEEFFEFWFEYTHL